MPFAVPIKATVNLAVLKKTTTTNNKTIRAQIFVWLCNPEFWARSKSTELDLGHLKHLVSVLCRKCELYVRIIWELNFYTPLLETFEVFGGVLYK